MHRCLSALPRPELRAYVRAFAQREIFSSTSDIVEPVFAGLESTLELDFKNTPVVDYVNGVHEVCCPFSVVGPHTYRRAWIRLRGPVESFGVFFRPLAMWQLFRVPVGLLVNQAYTAEAILGNEVLPLWQRMAECVSFRERVCLMEGYLLRRAANLIDRTEVVSSALHVLRFQGTPSISNLANDAALSVRQFERRFVQEIGMAPKLFARIARYQSALDSKLASPARSWLGVAHEFGYHDQMHMIRDFQSLSGSSPNGFLLEIGDMRPPASDGSSEYLIQTATA
jgi:methylphosphotriester-DNA--protein-cysteine methyltransferase